MKPLATIEIGEWDCQEEVHIWALDYSEAMEDIEVGVSLVVLPGGDWFMVGSVAFRGKPCDDCQGTGLFYTGTPADHSDQQRCSSCHGWGVIPIDGDIEWRCRHKTLGYNRHGNAAEFGCGPNDKAGRYEAPGHEEDRGCGWVLVLRVDDCVADDGHDKERT